MKLYIDTEVISNNNLDFDEFCYMLSIQLLRPIKADTIDRLKQKGLILKNADNNYLPFRFTYTGDNLMKQTLMSCEFGGSENKPERFELLADKLRELYPKGSKPGTHCMWRDSRAVIATRLKALVKKYNVEFTDEEAIDATKRYVESFNGNYTYMQTLKYFISKQKPVEGAPAEQNSQFLSYLENKDSTFINDNDWTANLV